MSTELMEAVSGSESSLEATWDKNDPQPGKTFMFYYFTRCWSIYDCYT